MRRVLIAVVVVALLAVATSEQVSAGSKKVEFEIVKSAVSGTFSVRGDIGDDTTVEPGEEIELTCTVSDSKTTLELDLSPYGSYSESFDTPIGTSISIPIAPIVPGVLGISLKVSGDLNGRLEFDGGWLPPSDLEWNQPKSIYFTYTDYDFEDGTDITASLELRYTVDVSVTIDLPWPLSDIDLVSFEAFAIDGSPTLQKTIHVRSPESSADSFPLLVIPIIAVPAIVIVALLYLRMKKPELFHKKL